MECVNKYSREKILGDKSNTLPLLIRKDDLTRWTKDGKRLRLHNDAAK